MPFHIFRLPQIAVSDILSLMDPREMLGLSFCSVKTFNILKSLIRRNSNIDLWMNDILYVSLVEFYSHGKYKSLVQAKEIGEVPDTVKETVKIGGYNVPIKWGTGFKVWITFWKNKNFGFKIVMDHVLFLFKKDIDYLLLHKKSFWIIDYINNRQQSLSNVYFRGHGLNYSDYSRILNWDMDHLRMEVAYSRPSFEYKGLFGARLTIWLKNAAWINVNNLLAMEQTEIFLEGTKFKNSDINKFLKIWMKGGNDRLRFLHCTLRGRLELSEICSGIAEEESLDGETCEYKSIRGTKTDEYPTGSKYKFASKTILRRSDGATAFFQHEGKRLIVVFRPYSNLSLPNSVDIR